MKRVKITKANTSSVQSLIRWYKKHGLIVNKNVFYDGAKISEEDDAILNKKLSPFDYFNYAPYLDNSLKKGEAMVLTEEEIKYRIKRNNLLDK